MIENVNPSYETLIKRLQKIWQQSQSNNDSIKVSQPDNSKITLEPNWIQSIGIVEDTRSTDGTDQPVNPISYTTLVQDVLAYETTDIPITYNIITGLMPMTVSYTYQEILPNITEDILPFLEYQTTFSVPKGNMSLAAGFLWNVDFWASKYVVIANGTTIWDGFDPPFATSIEVSQYQIDNNYATYYQQSWGLIFTSSEGGYYGHGESIGVILLSIYDTTANVYIPISADVISTFNPTHSYEFFVWSNIYETVQIIQYSLLTTSTITEHTGAYVCFWSATLGQGTPFYIYENVISEEDIILELFPPTLEEMINPLNPITFTINTDGPTKYSDIIGQSLSVYVNAPVSYDPFYIRQSKSTDAKESWQSNVTFGALVLTQGVATAGQPLLQYNDTYNWKLVDSEYVWVSNYDHETIYGNQYEPIESDMTTRVRVGVRPIVNWKKTDKYQV